jgi:Transposase family tnp2
MACLNLPVDMCHKPRNLFYTGIFPGPQEPRTEKANYLLKPLVEQLMHSWENGMWFNKTIAYPGGHLVHSALATLVCDSLAAHKITGCKSHPACNLCPSQSGKVDLHNIKYRAWGECTYVKHMEAAEQWCDASSRAQCKRVFDRTGTWWSELLCLPYSDPTHFIVIDRMHNLWLELLQFHVHVLLGINESKFSNVKELKRVKSILSCT